MDKNKSGIKKFSLIIFFIIIFLLFIFSVFFSLININNNNILNGICINGIDISGMSKEEATNLLSNMINTKAQNNITISTSENSQTTTFDYLEVNYDISSCVNQAFLLGRSGNIFENNFQILNLILNGENFELNITLNEDNLNTLISDISANLPNKVIQSSYYVENQNLIITKGTSGDTIDITNFKNKIYDTLNNLSLENSYIDAPIINVFPDEINIDKIYEEVHKDAKNAYYETNPFKIYSEVVGVSFDKEKAKQILQLDQTEYLLELSYTYPEITINDLGIDIFKDTLASFTTNYNVSDKDRSTNLELAASKINGTILSPGEEFSYNTIVGARTIAAGYKEAKIYSNGAVVDGLGGGICQISSTLYNAIIYANLDVTQRYNHQFLTSYVPAGRDATVVYGVKDLKFVNNRSYPIKIEMKVSNGIVYCSVLRN